MTTDKSISTHEKSEDYSENIDNEEKSITEEAKNNFLTNEFKEKVNKFIHIDDRIRAKQNEIKELKNKRKPCEDFIIEYLQQCQEEIINTKDGKLVKKESSTKGGLKMDIIKDSILEKSKNEKIFDSEDKYNRFLESIIELMDKKRPIKKKVNLRRVLPRKKNNIK
jgi:predicted flavoprotein YhiN